MMTLIQELKQVLPIGEYIPKIHYPIFEDKISCIEMAKRPEMRPTTKHIRMNYQYSRSFSKQALVTVYYADTLNQMAGIFTNALSEPHFFKLRRKMNGW